MIEKYIIPIAIFLGIILLQGCSSENNSNALDFQPLSSETAEVALEWNKFYLEIERYTEGFRPPVSARTLSYIGLAAYEAVVPAMNNHRSVINQFTTTSMPDLDEDAIYDWPLVLHSTYSRMFHLFFASAPSKQQYELQILMERLNESLSEDLHIYNKQKSIERGTEVADIIFNWAKTDELGHDSHTKNISPNYVPPQGIGLWQPTFPDFLEALTPYWGEVRTYVANEDLKARNPLVYSEDSHSQLYAQALETQIIVNEVRSGNRFEDQWIADFWSDDCPILTFTPVGRWLAITNQALEQESSNLDEAVFLYAKLGLALHDAGVRCWSEKFRFNYLRPIEYIRNVMGDDQWNTIMCPDGSGQFFTPNFPTYPSGHATFAGSAAAVLTDVLGNHFSMTDKCHENRTEFLGKPRSFQSFQQMAEECAYSRIPLGVHFRMDSEAGLQLGQKVGRAINLDINWYK